MIKTILVFLLLGVSFLETAKAQSFCPYADNFIYPRVSASVENLKDGNFKYSYSISNDASSALPIFSLMLETFKLHSNVQQPTTWNVTNWVKGGENLLLWSTKIIKTGDVLPGSAISGFSFISSRPPGLIKFQSQGANYRPFKTQNVLESDVLNLCPGIYQAGSSIDGLAIVEGMTIGPIQENKINAELRIRKTGTKSWVGGLKDSTKELLSFSPTETGKVEVALLGNSTINPEDISLNSINFGRGNAKPLSSSIGDCDISSKEKVKALVMTFNIQDVNVLCNTSQALFLAAKTKNGEDLFAGVNIKPTFCDQENWQREASKMIQAGEIDVPAGKYKAK